MVEGWKIFFFLGIGYGHRRTFIACFVIFACLLPMTSAFKYITLIMSGDWSTGWHANRWSHFFVCLSFDIYPSCPSWSSWLCRSSTGMFLIHFEEKWYLSSGVYGKKYMNLAFVFQLQICYRLRSNYSLLERSVNVFKQNCFRRRCKNKIKFNDILFCAFWLWFLTGSVC